jgi:hypothetical protein
MKVEIGKQYQTEQAHWPARILCTNAKLPGLPVIGLLTVGGGEELHTFTAEGKFTSGGAAHGYDLVEVKPAHTRYYYVTPDNGFLTLEAAQDRAYQLDNPRGAVVKVTFKEGDGL